MNYIALSALIVSASLTYADTGGIKWMELWWVPLVIPFTLILKKLLDKMSP